MFRDASVGFGGRVLVVLSFMVASTSCADQLELGEACSSANDCQSGHCEAFADIGTTGRICTQECANIGEGCSSDLICRENGMCGPRCVGTDHDDERACTQGISVACASLDAGVGCLDCGCESYGGGECVVNEGCFFYASNGEPCGGNVRCSNGNCDPESGVCITPIEQGEPLEDGVCMRSPCDDDVAPCPAGWACLEATDGQNHCFERCYDSDYYCEAGICQGEYCQSAQ